ncbi:MAG TPA: branched-chain amino acid ABC transporter permease [Acidilobales archaeon]|nr:branched-chain amino acid ABC transporter permease [Acidilobales archaeon]
MVLVRVKALDRKTITQLLVVLIIFSLLPFVLGFNTYYIYLAAQVVLTAIMALAWNIIGGYAGQLDLAATAYLGIGGAISGLLLAFYKITPWIGMPLGALAAIGLAVMVGYPTFRFGIKEVWYALLTASLVVIIQRIFWLIYGSTEIYLPYFEWSWYYLRFGRYEPLYYMLVVMLVFVLWLNIVIKRSKLGYYLAAIREDELAAEALGIDVRKYKLYALMIYAGILGFVGGIYVSLTSIVTYRMFNPWLAIVIAVIGLVGGLGSIAGVLTAAVILRSIEEYLRGTLGATIPGLYLLIYGLLIVLVGVLKPEGLGGLIESIRRRFRGGSYG